MNWETWKSERAAATLPRLGRTYACAAGSISKKLVAVVDDEPDICKALKRLLHSEGFNVETFPSGQEFLRSLPEHRPDGLVLDLHLPGLTGLEVREHVVAIGMRFPVIIITGRDEPGLAQRVLAAGAAAFLLKPVNDVELLGALNAAFRCGREGTAE